MTALATSRSSYIPWLFVAAFALVVAVNGTMMWLAIDSFSGLYVQKPRERGVHYNEVLASQRVRDALGWQVELSWQAGADNLTLQVRDAAGAPLAGAAASVDLVRPTEKLRPLRIELTAMAPGSFSGRVVLPRRGNWDADIAIEKDGHRFALTKRLFLQ